MSAEPLPPSPRRRAGSAVVEAAMRGILGAIDTGDGPTPLQLDLLDAIGMHVAGLDVPPHELQPLGPDELAAIVTDPGVRDRTVQVMVLMELVLHPVPRALDARVRRYAAALGVDDPALGAARELARDQVALMYADIERNSWYTEETKHLIRHGHLRELLRSKLAYVGVAPDHRIASRWRALGDLPEDTWGRAVFDFYREHHFPLPGERHGIYEVGARHDWVHVLTGYPPTPEGEIDVFTFIAAVIPDRRGFMQLVTTLALFQNGSITYVMGKRIPIARADTLSDSGAVDRFADALRRGVACTTDVMSMDQFAYADRPLDEVRAEFNVLPKAPDGQAPATGAEPAPA